MLNFQLIILLLLLFNNDLLANNRIKLDVERIPEWKKRNNFNSLNHGPFFGQPEQIHLSYGGFFF